MIFIRICVSPLTDVCVFLFPLRVCMWCRLYDAKAAAARRREKAERRPSLSGLFEDDEEGGVGMGGLGGLFDDEDETPEPQVHRPQLSPFYIYVYIYG